METFTMSRKEVPRAGLVKAALAGKITNKEGARALRLSVRQFQRLKGLLRAEGVRTQGGSFLARSSYSNRTGTRGRPPSLSAISATCSLAISTDEAVTARPRSKVCDESSEDAKRATTGTLDAKRRALRTISRLMASESVSARRTPARERPAR